MVHRSSVHRAYGVQMPLTRHALQCVGAAVVEGYARASHEVLDGTRHEHLARARLACDAGADVHGDAADLCAHHLALAGVHPRANLQAERANATADGRGTADGPGRPVEGSKEAVARSVDLSPPIALQLVTGRTIEAVEQLVPAGIAELRGPL